MYYSADRAGSRGISAVLQSADHLDSAVLDLAAVLEGLVAEKFEIILVSGASEASSMLADLRARAPGLPLRSVRGDTIAAGCASAAFNLIFVCAADGRFDVRELNHLMDAIEKGADVAAGYRPRRTDGIFRHLQRWGWRVEVDCAFKLFRRAVWNEIARHMDVHQASSCAELLTSVRRLGFEVAEVPVSHRRPTIGAPASAWRAA
jgi:hypothetical protein